MKLIPICNCKEDKVITGQWDGEMIWRLKGRLGKDMSYTWKGDPDKEFEVYQAQAD